MPSSLFSFFWEEISAVGSFSSSWCHRAEFLTRILVTICYRCHHGRWLVAIHALPQVGLLVFWPELRLKRAGPTNGQKTWKSLWLLVSVNVFISQGKGGTRSLCVWCSGCIVGLNDWGVSSGGGTGWFDFDRRKGQIGKLVYKSKQLEN